MEGSYPNFKVFVDVTNAGDVAGKETVQIYVGKPDSAVERAMKELRGFAKLELQPGETKTVTIPLRADDLAFVDYEGKWVLEEGEFQLTVGQLSTKIHCTDTYHWTTANR